MTASRVAALALLAALAAAPQASAQGGFGMPDPSEQQAPAVPPPMMPKQFPLGVTFEATTLNGRAFEGERPALTLDETLRLRGFSGCNNYSATAYPLRDQGFAVGPFALTRRECDNSTMQKERTFLEALRAAQTWDTEGPRLTIKGPRGELVLERAL
ncbi:META domain-containing protein [Salinarimonas sp. NSM]|uniref:META domain-containing protein n=1 Tax=Salinarimonas sp. NSM TaxID=3458003 RepID=UPI00403650A1